MIFLLLHLQSITHNFSKFSYVLHLLFISYFKKVIGFIFILTCHGALNDHFITVLKKKYLPVKHL